MAKAIRYLLSFDPDYLPSNGGLRAIILPPAVFGRVFAWMPKASLLLQPNLVVAGVNRAFETASGRTADALLGSDLFQLFPDNAVDSEGGGEKYLEASLMRVLETGAPDHMARLRYDIRNAQGRFEPRWWDTINAPVFDDDGRIRHILHQAREITAEVCSA